MPRRKHQSRSQRKIMIKILKDLPNILVVLGVVGGVVRSGRLGK